MTNVSCARCVTCGLFQVKKAGEYCSICNPNKDSFQKRKEMEVVNFLRAHEYEFTHNLSVGDVCSSFRPDILIDCGTHHVVVEIDEDQHSQYEDTCEVVRMMAIYQTIGMRTVFIRYNPDKYRINGHEKQVSSEVRLDYLKTKLDKAIKEIPKKELTVYKMFYDDHAFMEDDITPIVEGLLKGEAFDYCKLLT